MKSTKIGIIGAGGWGTAISFLLSNNGYDVHLWVYESDVYEQLQHKKENKRYLPGIILPERIMPYMELHPVIDRASVVVFAVPSHVLRSIAEKSKDFIKKDQILVSVVKGLENETYLRMSQILGEIFPENKIAVLSGPSHAEEVARNIPTTIVVSSEDRNTAEYIQEVFISSRFRVYTNPDLVGVEIAGALKNVIAIGAGISDGLGFGDNTRAALMTRGIVEIARLGHELGADSLTFAGLAGIGDLIVTCNSVHSRNRRAGMQIGQGLPLKEVLNNIGMVVEGVKTTSAAYELAKQQKIEMPITEQIYDVLFNGKQARMAVEDLMLRDKTQEIEEIVKKTF